MAEPLLSEHLVSLALLASNLLNWVPLPRKAKDAVLEANVLLEELQKNPASALPAGPQPSISLVSAGPEASTGDRSFGSQGPSFGKAERPPRPGRPSKSGVSGSASNRESRESRDSVGRKSLGKGTGGFVKKEACPLLLCVMCVSDMK